MAWENNVKNIVMLNKLFENGRKKCEQYWPERIGLYMNCQGGTNVSYKITLKGSLKISVRKAGRRNFRQDREQGF